MKTLLIALNAKYIHSNLGVYCIAAYAREHGITEEELQKAEYTINQPLEKIMADIYEKKPDFLAFSCYVWNINRIIQLTRELRKVLPDVPIWLGGPEVTYQPEEIMQKVPWVTGIIMGEGEATCLELVQSYSREGSDVNLSEIAGIAYRDGKQIRIGKKRPLLSLDEVPFPYEDMRGLEYRIIYYESSRGCPYGCSYCLSSVEKQVRFRSIDKVKRELQFFMDHRVPQVKFVDRTFNCSAEHTMAIWKYIYEHDNGITNFHFELAADLLTEEQIQFIGKFRPGMVQFEIGVQSVNPRTLEAIHRKTDLGRLRQKVEAVRVHRNIHQHLDLIAGLPYEDLQSFRHSFDEVYNMKPDQLQLGFLKVLKGSPLQREIEKFGITAQQEPPYEVLYTDWLDYQDILLLKRVEEMVERYYNSMQFEAATKYLVQLFLSPFACYEKLGNYYHACEWDQCQQSRIQKYEFLWEFAQEYLTEAEREIFREMLCFDLYARENLKKRPDFLPDMILTPEQRKKRREFYQSPQVRKKYLPEYVGCDWKQLLRMTHREKFSYDLLLFLENGTLEKRPTVILFDYQKRNPLNHQVQMVEIRDW